MFFSTGRVGIASMVSHDQAFVVPDHISTMYACVPITLALAEALKRTSHEQTVSSFTESDLSKPNHRQRHCTMHRIGSSVNTHQTWYTQLGFETRLTAVCNFSDDLTQKVPWECDDKS